MNGGPNQTSRPLVQMNLLFDLDGTLTDSFEGITKSISYALERMGIPPPPREHLGWCIGPPLRRSFMKLLGKADDKLAEKALSFYRERFRTVGLFENRVYDGIPEALEALNIHGHTLFVATSKPAIFANRVVDHFSLRRYFKAIYGSELDGRRQDKTRLISHILERESIARPETLMIGDRAQDMIGAKANGLQAIAILWGYGTKDELNASGARSFIATPQELIDLVSGS